MEAWDAAAVLSEQAIPFYQQMFGFDIRQTPEEIFNSRAYLRQIPLDIVKEFDVYGVSKEESHLYWIVRFAKALPLPPEYVKMVDDNGDCYFNKFKLLKVPLHPGNSYIKELVRLERNRSRVNKDGLEQNIAKIQDFIDDFERPQRVDLFMMRLAIEDDKEAYLQYV